MKFLLSDYALESTVHYALELWVCTWTPRCAWSHSNTLHTMCTVIK